MHHVIANGPDSSWISVMCRASRFQITVSLDDLRGSSFEREYSQLVEEAGDSDNQDDDGCDALCSWIVKPCLAYFKERTPHVPTDLTFQGFYYPPTYHLKLVVSRHLPQYPHVSHIKASQVQIVTQISDEYDYMSEIPRQAIVGDGTVKFFKPSLDKAQVIREIDVQSRILNAGLKGKLRVAGVHSIVTSEDATMTIGLLFDLIPPFAEPMDSLQCKVAIEQHSKWKQQVIDIVTELHAHDIVWGDVHPGNIFVDKDSDAWLMDFGGGWIEEFVDSEIAGTKEGDLQGLGRIFDEWLSGDLDSE
ncbi:hypothetical protein V491_04031 [Pseudogymnoascus sp. VKM F-3775]|nr:hypothetical protein V491_04031 [Pseudogymnoascus sp. VKM F-3775]